MKAQGEVDLRLHYFFNLDARWDGGPVWTIIRGTKFKYPSKSRFVLRLQTFSVGLLFANNRWLTGILINIFRVFRRRSYHSDSGCALCSPPDLKRTESGRHCESYSKRAVFTVSVLFVITKTLAKGHGTVYIGDSFSTLIRSGCATLCDRFRWEVHR